MTEIGIIAKKTASHSGTSQTDGQAWASAEYLIEIPAEFPRHMLVEVFDKGTSQRIAKFDALMGQMANIDFIISAREYNGKWYNKIKAYNVAPYMTTTEEKPAVDATAAAFANIPTAPEVTPEPKPNDLPF